MGSYERFISHILPGVGKYDFADKDRNIANIVRYMLDRTQQMFSWEGLPDTIPSRMLEVYLQTNGNVCITEVKGDLYAFTGGPGGEPSPYYQPTIYTVANPALKFDKSLVIGQDCEIILSDSLYQGLIPMMRRYATGIVEAELSIYVALINSRLVDVFESKDDRGKIAFDKMIQDVVDGKLSVVSVKSLDGVMKAFPYTTSTARTLTDLIEITQYLKASWFNELGLNANYNMKRESINSGESQLNNDALLPLVDDMLNQRKEGAERVNKMYGTNISVALASSWEDNEQEIKLEQEQLENPEENSARAENDDTTEERKE